MRSRINITEGHRKYHRHRVVSEPTAMNERTMFFPIIYYYSRIFLDISDTLNPSSQRAFLLWITFMSLKERERSTELLDTICSCNNNLCPVLPLPPPSFLCLHPLPAYIITDFSLPGRESLWSGKTRRNNRSLLPSTDCEIALFSIYRFLSSNDTWPPT